jgi:hypothetical protein
MSLFRQPIETGAQPSDSHGVVCNQALRLVGGVSR